MTLKWSNNYHEINLLIKWTSVEKKTASLQDNYWIIYLMKGGGKAGY